MDRPNTDQVLDMSDEAIAAVREIAKRWPGVIKVEHDMGPGYSPISGGAGVSGGDISDPTFDRATTHDIDPTVAAAAWLDRWWKTLRELRHLERQARSLVPDQPELEREDHGVQNCGACCRPVAGTDTDRLRSGWCDACRKAWKRAGKPDRAWFARQRRKDNAA